MPTVAHPPWTTPLPDEPPQPLIEDTETDVCVVGGGIAGLATAWFAARNGRAVVLLEARRVGRGVTGHSTAKVTALQGDVYHSLSRRHGPPVARHYARAQLAGLDALAGVIEGEALSCEWERLPAYTYAPGADDVGTIRSEASAARRAGLPVTLLDGDEVPAPFQVAAAVRLDDQAQVNIGLLMDEWRRAAERAGVRVHEETRVTGLHVAGGVRVETERGHTVRARDVVVATHYPIVDRALLFPRVRVTREFALTATAPAPLDGTYYGIGDGLSIRRWREEYVVTGRTFRPGSGTQEEVLHELERAAQEQVPGLGPVTSRWAAQDITSHDGLPYVGRMLATTSHVHVATAFRTWGLTNGVAAGLAIAARIEGGREPWSRVFEPARTLLPAGVPALLTEQAVVARKFATGLVLRGGDPGAGLAPGEGILCRVDGKECAVARDETGRVHVVGSRCTHLGCRVSFNPVEQTWECGCHGSRFALDGSVLSGPAVRPLPPRVDDIQEDALVDRPDDQPSADAGT